MYSSKPAAEDVDGILTAIVMIRTDFICRVSHPEPGMEQKKDYKKLIEDFNKQAEELQKMEESKQIFCIAPKEPVKVGRLEHNVKKLKDLYESGYADAKESFDEMIKYLEQDQKSAE